MAVSLTQANRWLMLETPLGTDVLVATSLRGSEGMSRLFEFKIDALSQRTAVAPGDLLGKSVTVSITHPGGERRIVNGIVTALVAGATTRNGHRIYTLTVHPTLWVSKRSSDYKIFQGKTVTDIVEDILKADGVKYEKKLNASYKPREYCVQFGETNLDFIERLMAEEGIFYYFKHASGNHTMVLADHRMAYEDCAQATVAYRQDKEESSDAVFAMNFGLDLTDTKWTLQDYDFERPAATISASKPTVVQPSSSKSWEHFAYPGGTVQNDDLTRLATAAIEAEEAEHESVDGQSTCASFTPGHRFTLAEHPAGADANKAFVLTRVEHEVYDRTHFTIRPGMGGKPSYRNRFRGIPSTRIARTPFVGTRPLAHGPQTAVVVGTSGEEIHTDKYGRIRVQFHWDRYGSKNEKSSCFVRVAQSLAGKNWGTVFTPRIGMEVVVQFLEGDPDRPLVTGAVYNAENMPPWTLPDEMTKSGFRSRSTKQGAVANANELVFEDKKGSEQILFHAEKDFLREVENDDTLDVGHDQTRTIKNDRTSTISEGNETFTIKQGNRTEKIEKGNETLDIGKGNRKVTLGQGNDELTLSQGNRTTTLSQGNDSLTLSTGNQSTKATAGKITLEAGQSITLKCGPSTVELTPSGITIKGAMVTVEGSAKATVKGPMVDVAGDGMVTVKGGIVKIN